MQDCSVVATVALIAAAPTVACKLVYLAVT